MDTKQPLEVEHLIHALVISPASISRAQKVTLDKSPGGWQTKV